MGHTISATVLQMHQGMSVIAAGGVLLRPQVIKEISNANGEVIFRAGREVLNRAVSTETAQEVAKMLMGVVAPGAGGEAAAIAGFDVAGKTGTTQKLINGVYSNKHHVGSFVGFFPAGDPQVVISVIVDEAKVDTPRGVAYGRLVAAPSFKRLGERLIPVLEIKSDTKQASPRLYATTQGGRR
jgi:cell division protein FtsI/penicillin-binding protein 2